MHPRSALRDLIRRGQRRQICHSAVTAVSFALALALGGAILLLVAGTQILNWYWIVLLAAGSLAFAAYREHKRISSGYEIAQEIDRRLGLHDVLSTAFYFDRPSQGGDTRPAFVEHQRRLAEDAARSADIGRGVPFRPPRTLYINATLAVLACGMFGLRYGIQRSLDLGPPLVRIAFDGFLGQSRDLADARKGKRPLDEDGRRDPGAAVDPLDSKSDNLNAARDSALNTVEDPDVNNPDNGADAKAKAKGAGSDKGNDVDNQSAADAKEQQQGLDNEKGDSNSSPEGDSKLGKQPSSGKNSSRSGGEGDNSSLADKLRDALSSMLAKLKPQSKSSDSQQHSGSQSSSQQNSRQHQPQDSAQDANQEQADANSGGESQGEQQQGGIQQSAEGKSQGNSNDRPSSPDGKSGIGNQDGDKSAREAADLAAMGKINEIIGKRAANLTGEVMVEVSSGKQQLRTQYSQTDATHVEAGGEINRDEIPLAYQQYVQHYFEEIRKLPPAKSTPQPDKSNTAGN